MSGKGSKPRPISVGQEQYASNWDAVFGARRVASEVSKISESGSCPDAPAIYIDNETGAQVTEEWWPGDAINQEK